MYVMSQRGLPTSLLQYSESHEVVHDCFPRIAWLAITKKLVAFCHLPDTYVAFRELQFGDDEHLCHTNYVFLYFYGELEYEIP